jgi:hypothetical protein
VKFSNFSNCHAADGGSAILLYDGLDTVTDGLLYLIIHSCDGANGALEQGVANSELRTTEIAGSIWIDMSSPCVWTGKGKDNKQWTWVNVRESAFKNCAWPIFVGEGSCDGVSWHFCKFDVVGPTGDGNRYVSDNNVDNDPVASGLGPICANSFVSLECVAVSFCPRTN